MNRDTGHARSVASSCFAVESLEIRDLLSLGLATQSAGPALSPTLAPPTLVTIAQAPATLMEQVEPNSQMHDSTPDDSNSSDSAPADSDATEYSSSDSAIVQAFSHDAKDLVETSGRARDVGLFPLAELIAVGVQAQLTKSIDQASGSADGAECQSDASRQPTYSATQNSQDGNALQEYARTETSDQTPESKVGVDTHSTATLSSVTAILLVNGVTDSGSASWNTGTLREPQIEPTAVLSEAPQQSGVPASPTRVVASNPELSGEAPATRVAIPRKATNISPVPPVRVNPPEDAVGAQLASEPTIRPLPHLEILAAHLDLDLPTLRRNVDAFFEQLSTISDELETATSELTFTGWATTLSAASLAIAAARARAKLRRSQSGRWLRITEPGTWTEYFE
jgi:hypothetical protein